LSSETVISIAHIYKRMNPPNKLFKIAIISAGEHYENIRKDLPSYLTGTLEKLLESPPAA